VSILDLLKEPLDRTLQGDFELPARALADCDPEGTCTEAEYKALLAEADGIQGNVASIPSEAGAFDIVVAPYIQHHLNIYDKIAACEEMRRVTRAGGLMLVGDLYFDRDGYNEWLSRHRSERVPYAVESFITADQHRELLCASEASSASSTPLSYAFAVLRS
jgi:hypothetical protein